MNAVELHIWYAGHISGSKFYHVFRFISANGHSFAVRHYGANDKFTTMQSAYTGAIEEDEAIFNRTVAGLEKISSKRKGGYSRATRTEQLSFITVHKADEWVSQNLGGKGRGVALQHLSRPEWQVTAAPDFEDAKPAVRETDEADHVKHADWGSW